MLERYPADVKLVVKHYPFQKIGRKAAEASLAANMQGKFWDFHEELFALQGKIDEAKIQGVARELGLDVERLTNDMKSDFIRDLINRDIKHGNRIGVSVIPTIFVNGKLLKEHSFEGFQKTIETERARRGQQQ